MYSITLHQIILLLSVSLMAASFSHFLQKCLEKGMIFRGYAYFIKYYFDYKPRERKAWDSFSENHRAHVLAKSKPLWYAWFYKPLGGCIYCNSVWVGFAFFVLTSSPIWLVIPYTGLTYMWVELLFTFISHE